jgi:hypothetical protein
MRDMNHNGGPVFPGEQIAFTEFGHKMTLGHHNGMSLRAWLAGEADALLAELEKPRG